MEGLDPCQVFYGCLCHHWVDSPSCISLAVVPKTESHRKSKITIPGSKGESSSGITCSGDNCLRRALPSL